MENTNPLRVKAWRELEQNDDSIYCHKGECNEIYVPPHRHSRGQLLYAEGGRIYVVMQNKVWYLPARHYMWIPAETEHSLKISLASAQLWSLYFPAWKGEPSFYRKPGIYPVTNLLLEQLYFSQSWHGHVTPDNKPGYYFLTGIKAILPEISKSALPFDLPLPKDERLEKVVEHLQNNLSENIHTGTVAKKFGMSESTLARLFKKDLKMSFITYVSTLRILRSVELIAMGQLNVKEICYEVGYTSVPTFSNIFKKSVGVRPTTYLKAC